jgi:polyisoprenoid-binding protein YceI
MKKYALLMLTILAFTPSAFADWVLQNDQSEITFISVKSNTVAEIGEFKKFEGTIDKKGQVDIAVNLASVDTRISVRDERMKSVLFDVSKFAQAKLTGAVDVVRATALKVGERYSDSISLKLSLHGIEKTVPTDVTVIKLAGDTWMVTSTTPIILNARDYKLTAGIYKLRDLAGLSAISAAVPVMFNLVFKQ